MPVSINQALRKVQIQPREVTFWLEVRPEITRHYCPFCGKEFMRSQYRVFTIVYGEGGLAEGFLQPPFSVQCQKCGAIMHLAGLNA